MLQVKIELIKHKKYPYLKSAQDVDYYALINKYMNDTYCRGFKAPMGEDFFDDLPEEKPQE
jgi:hypothetical protein